MSLTNEFQFFLNYLKQVLDRCIADAMILYLAKWNVIDNVINGITQGGKDGIKDNELLKIIERCLVRTPFKSFMESRRDLSAKGRQQSWFQPNEKTQWYASAVKKMAWMSMSVQEAFLQMKPMQYQTQCNIDTSYILSLSNSLLLSMFTSFEDKGEESFDGNMAEKILKVTLPSGERKYSCYCRQNKSGEIVFYYNDPSRAKADVIITINIVILITLCLLQFNIVSISTIFNILFVIFLDDISRILRQILARYL